MDVIKVIADTPLPTLLALIGLVLVLTGFGLRMTIVFDVEHLNKTVAKVLGAALLLAGLALHASALLPGLSSRPFVLHDPFLVYYATATPVVVGLLWASLRFAAGPMQLRSVRVAFVLIGVVVLAAVAWRGLDVFFFVASGGRGSPLELYERHSYVPYLLLLSAGAGAALFLIYRDTRQGPNAANRLPLVRDFAVFCIYLALCRVAWEAIDYVGRWRIPAPPG